MPATKLDATVRYYPPGVRQYYWCPTIADINNPARTELDASIDLTDEIVDGGVSGFMVSPSTVDAPDAGTTFTAMIKGRSSVGTSSITFYTTSDGTPDIRESMHEDDIGYLVIFPEGDHAPETGPPAKTFRMNIWPSTVMTDPALETDMSKPGQVTVTFAATGKPASNVAVPA